jgi:DNA-binding protein H-NS
MIGESTTPMQLCPYCANSIAADAAKCSYCQADLLSGIAPKWLNRNEPSSEPRVGLTRQTEFPIPSKFIWAAGMLVVVLSAFFTGDYLKRRELSLLSQANQKQLQAKEEIIQSQQAQLAQVQQQLSANANQLSAMKNKLEESQKALSATQRRLSVASRDAGHSSASRSVAARRTASRAPATPPSPGQPVAARRTVQPGVYETTQATTVYENPSSAARAISQIGRGTRINVVRSSGDWLEVRSNRGNPPGFVRTNDARLIARAN